MTISRKIPLPTERADPVVRDIRIRSFRHLLDTGRPMPTDQFGAEQRQAIAELCRNGRLTLDDDGRIAGSLGLTIEPTRHRIDLAEGVRYTWCALDALAIMAALRRSGTVVSQIPDTSETIGIRYEAGQVTEAPSQTVLLVPAAPTGSVVETWCPLTNLFPDPESAHTWAGRRGVAAYSLVTLPEAVAEGTLLWTALLDDRAAADPDRQNAQAVADRQATPGN